MTIDELLANLERSNLVSSDAIRQLRERVSRAPDKFGPRTAIQWLVDRGHVTPAQGQRLLATADTSEFSGRGGDDAGFDAAGQAAIDDLDPADELDPASPGGEPRGRKPWSTAPSGRSRSRQKRGDPMLDALAPVDAAPIEPEAAVNEKRRWDSPLILVGGGVLLLLLIAMPVFYFILTSQSADAAIEAADQNFNSGNHLQCIEQYNLFLESYPSHEAAGRAKVRRGLARVWQAVKLKSDWKGAFATAKENLQEIRELPEYEQGDVVPQIADIWPAIAEGLTGLAEKNSDRQYLDMANDALKQLPLYVPKANMPVDRIARIREQMATVEIAIRRESAALDAIKQMTAFLGEKNTTAAYDVRKTLLKSFPELRDDARLKDMIIQLSAEDREIIGAVNEPREAETEERETATAASFSLAVPTVVGDAEGAANGNVLVLANGAVYALDAANGTQRWSRHVGHDTAAAPMLIPDDPAGDAILSEVDSFRRRFGVLRVNAKTGELVWRYDVGEPFITQPVLIGDRLVVSTRGDGTHAGRLVSIDLASGRSDGYTQLPQELKTAAAGGVNGQLYYQTGEHSNLYVVAAQDGKCLEVYYLGHERDAIRVPPLVVPPYVFIAENRRGSDCFLHVLRSDARGGNLTPYGAAGGFDLKGQVVTPMQLQGGNLLVATDRFALHVYEILAPGKPEALATLTSKPAEMTRDPRTPFALYINAQLFVASEGVSRYDVAAASGNLNPIWFKDESDTFLGQPQWIDGVLYHARYRKGRLGVTIAAVNPNDGKTFWEVQVASPPWGAPVIENGGKRALAMNAAGGLFDIDLATASGRQAAIAVDVEPNIEWHQAAFGPIPMPGGQIAYSPGAGHKRLLIAEPAGAEDRLKSLLLENPLGPPPAAFRGGFLVPGQVGQVFGIDATAGTVSLQPFQPPQEGVDQTAWGMPTVLDENRAMIADNKRRVFILGVEDAPVPHLISLKQGVVPQILATQFAIAGQTAYAVDLDGGVQAISLEDLKAAPVMQIASGRVAWGPFAVGNQALLTTDDGAGAGRLVCLADGKVAWEQPLAHGALAGAPLQDGDGAWLVAGYGTVYKVALADGAALGEGIDAGQPLAAGPVAAGERLVVSGIDGSIHVLAKP